MSLVVCITERTVTVTMRPEILKKRNYRTNFPVFVSVIIMTK